jgi:hypothetical protein
MESDEGVPRGMNKETINEHVYKKNGCPIFEQPFSHFSPARLPHYLETQDLQEKRAKRP